MVSPFLYATFIFAVFHFNGNFLSVILLCSTMLIPSFVDSPAIFKSLGLTLSGPVALSGFIGFHTEFYRSSTPAGTTLRIKC